MSCCGACPCAIALPSAHATGYYPDSDGKGNWNSGIPTTKTWSSLTADISCASVVELPVEQAASDDASTEVTALRPGACVGDRVMTSYVEIDLGEQCTMGASNGFGCPSGSCWNGHSLIECWGGRLGSKQTYPGDGSGAEVQYESIAFCEGARYVKMWGGGSCGRTDFLSGVNALATSISVVCGVGAPPSPLPPHEPIPECSEPSKWPSWADLQIPSGRCAPTSSG